MSSLVVTSYLMQKRLSHNKFLGFGLSFFIIYKLLDHRIDKQHTTLLDPYYEKYEVK